MAFFVIWALANSSDASTMIFQNKLEEELANLCGNITWKSSYLVQINLIFWPPSCLSRHKTVHNVNRRFTERSRTAASFWKRVKRNNAESVCNEFPTMDPPQNLKPWSEILQITILNLVRFALITYFVAWPIIVTLHLLLANNRSCITI